MSLISSNPCTRVVRAVRANESCVERHRAAGKHQRADCSLVRATRARGGCVKLQTAAAKHEMAAECAHSLTLCLSRRGVRA